MPSDLPPLRDVIRRYGLGAKKSLGQHFLLDANLTSRIARAAAPLKNKRVVEVGPGPGGLTRSLLAEGAIVYAIERDDRCIQALQELQASYPETLKIVPADALKLKLHDVVEAPFSIVANLPYNVGTAMLINWLEELSDIEQMVLMFQKEVAERIDAEPNTPAYGRLAILCQLLCDTRILFNVDKRAFTPPPKVMSAVIELMPRENPLFETDVKKLEIITRAAFGQRRKMLRSSLKSLGINPEDAGIDPQERAEKLSIEQFCALARLI